MKPEVFPTEKEDNMDIEKEATEPGADTAAESIPETTQNTNDAECSEGAQDDLSSDELEVLQAEVADLNDKLLRALAETENTRRRAERDKVDASKYAVTSFAREMLSVSDTLQRALGSVDADARKEHAVIEQLFVGLEMNDREIKNIFERFGIKSIEAMGEKFDHNFHEALFEIEDPSKLAGTVVQVVETGYVLKDRLLRPSKVGVSKGGPALEKEVPNTDIIPDEKTQEDDLEQKVAYENNRGKVGAQLDEEL